MADRKITELSALSAGSQATGDLLTIVDVSEAAAADKNKKITVESLFKGIPSDVGINTTSPTFPSGTGLAIHHTTASRLKFTNDATGQGASDGAHIYTSNTDFVIENKESGNMRFYVSGSERARFDASGRLLIGSTSSRVNAGVQPKFQVEGTGSDASLSLIRNTNNTANPYLLFAKSRGSSNGSNTIVQNGDYLGSIYFTGADGTDLNSSAAEIHCRVDGTPGSNDMPGRLVFSTTADNASSPTERLRISSEGKISTGGESSPDCNAGGLCLDQNAGDGIILSFKSSDISHGVTNFDQTDTYFSARKVSGAKGGLRLRAYTDAAGGDPAFFFQGIINSDTDSSYVPFVFQGGKASGVTIANIATNRKIIDIRDSAGGSLASFTGTGLTFNGDTAAANALNDYEEGSWTPVAFNNNNGASTTVRMAKYTKIGNRVYIQCYIQVAKGTNSGNYTIYGLPYTSSSVSDYHGGITIGYIQGLSTAISMAQATVQRAGNYILMRAISGTSATNSSSMNGNMLSTSSEVIISGHYMVD